MTWNWLHILLKISVTKIALYNINFIWQQGMHIYDLIYI